MDERRTIFIKAKPPRFFLFVSTIVITMAVVFLLSPFLNEGILALSTFMIFIGSFFLWLIDRSYRTISFDQNFLTLTGFFRIRSKKIQMVQISGYEIQQQIDEFNGLHDICIIALDSGEKIVFPRISYREEDYSDLVSMCKKSFTFLGYRKLKYAEILQRWIPAISLLSGILALLVAIKKLI